MPSSFKKCYFLLCSLFLFSISVNAEEVGKPLSEKLKNANITITSSIVGCDKDIKEYCDVLGNNTQKVFMCLAAYEDHLSVDCKQGILEAALSVKLGAAAIDYSIRQCEADVDRQCLDVQPGEGRLIDCIKSNEDDVSKECISALKETGLWGIE